MTRLRSVVVRGMALVALLAPPVLAQAPADPPAAAERRQGPPPRAEMERRVRQAMWAATQRRVGLSDDQMSRLGAVNRRYEPRRAALLRREREARRALRAEMTAGQPNEPRVGELLDALQRVQRDRLDLQVEEQRELAGFMTAVQRARYFALQEQFRRRLEELRQGSAGAPRPRLGPRRPPPPG